MDGAAKTGAAYEDAIEDAIIAMNEPKEASVGKLRCEIIINGVHCEVEMHLNQGFLFSSQKMLAKLNSEYIMHLAGITRSPVLVGTIEYFAVNFF